MLPVHDGQDPVIGPENYFCAGFRRLGLVVDPLQLLSKWLPIAVNDLDGHRP